MMYWLFLIFCLRIMHGRNSLCVRDDMRWLTDAPWNFIDIINVQIFLLLPTSSSFVPSIHNFVIWLGIFVRILRIKLYDRNSLIKIYYIHAKNRFALRYRVRTVTYGLGIWMCVHGNCLVIVQWKYCILVNNGNKMNE